MEVEGPEGLQRLQPPLPGLLEEMRVPLKDPWFCLAGLRREFWKLP